MESSINYILVTKLNLGKIIPSSLRIWSMYMKVNYIGTEKTFEWEKSKTLIV